MFQHRIPAHRARRVFQSADVIRRLIGIGGATAIVLSCIGPAARAQVVRDNTLGAGRNLSLPGPTIKIPHNFGVQRDGNLFHSFQTFDLRPGDVAEFTGPSSIRNVLTRVTGGRVSSIDGTLKCSIPGANFYLLSPGGITLGRHATIDVTGSFVAATADSVTLDRTGRFDARTPAKDVLTSAPPTAFGFLSSPSAGAINGLKATISLTGHGTVGLIGRHVKLTNCTLGSSGFVGSNAGLHLVAIGGAGGVAFDAATQTPAVVRSSEAPSGSLVCDDSFLAAFGLHRPGSVTLDAGTIALRGSVIFAGPFLTEGQIRLSADRDLCLVNSEANYFSSVDPDRAPLPTVMKLAGRNVSLTRSTVRSGFQGGAGGVGGIAIHADDRFLVTGGLVQTGGAEIRAPRSGNIDITARLVRLDGLNMDSPLLGHDPIASGISASANDSQFKGGDINLKTDWLFLSRKAVIGAVGTVARGGNIEADVAREITLDSGTITAGVAAGTPGKIRLNAKRIVLTNASAISSSVGGRSPDTNIPTGGGSITLGAADILISNASAITATGAEGAPSGSIRVTDNDGPLQLVGGSTISVSATGEGAAGSINIDARAIHVRGGTIAARSADDGDAGGLTIVGRDSVVLQSSSSVLASAERGAAGSINISSNTRIDITTSSVSVMSGGRNGTIKLTAPDITMGQATVTGEVTGDRRGGAVEIAAGSLRVLGGSQVLASTSGGGRGGSVKLTANDLTIDTSRVAASSTAAGDAGDVNLDARHVELRHDSVVASSGGNRANGGNIAIASPGNIDLFNSQITAQAANNPSAPKDGGNVAIQAVDRLYLLNSSINAEAGNNGGNITIDPQAVVLNNSRIIGNAVFGNGGNITITTPAFVRSIASTVSASSQFGLAGTVQILSPDADIVGQLVQLPQGLLAADARLQDTCAKRFEALSSFTLVPRGGLPIEPGMIPSSYDSSGPSPQPASDLRRKEAPQKPAATR